MGQDIGHVVFRVSITNPESDWSLESEVRGCGVVSLVFLGSIWAVHQVGEGAIWVEHVFKVAKLNGPHLPPYADVQSGCQQYHGQGDQPPGLVEIQMIGLQKKV